LKQFELNPKIYIIGMHTHLGKYLDGMVDSSRREEIKKNTGLMVRMRW